MLFRLSLITVYSILHKDFTDDVKELLETLIEICELAYAGADKRSPKSILRLFNVAFKHAYLLTNMFKESPSKITKEKLFGVYFHSLTCHLPEISRIIAPSSLHCENEERMFSDITAISRSTSSRTSDSIRDNAILRLQAEMEFKRNDKYKTETSKISSLTKACKYLKKSYITSY